MNRRLRSVPPGGALVEVTCRTFQTRPLLLPSPLLREITLGVLGRAQRHTGVALHAFVFLSTRYHLLASVVDTAQLARFAGFLNSNLGREIGRLRDWREKFWGPKYQAFQVREEEAVQRERLLHLARQGCKEGLFADPLEWPGATSWRAMLDGRPVEGTWFDRTAEGSARRRGGEFEASDFARPERVVLTPLPAWAHLEPEAQRARLWGLLEVVRTATAVSGEETGQEVLGASSSRSPAPP